MHEMGMCDAIVQAVLNRAEGRRVRSARVRVGGHLGGHEVDPALIDQGFRVAAAGTPAQDAEIEVEVVADELSIRCRDCGNRGGAADATMLVACPRCGGVDIEVTGGGEVEVESITFDERDRFDDAPAEQYGGTR
ncbi:hydrogenase maturation nickel metallochaperone HypA/HybF [Acrocarpospora catenulata]|uniref:hydrogenase maturation nickel metallochaperone HypA/HybF n=1 Tax=Acrocarpospora catenulata TaxID=2836182 RepID=UPI002023A66A|nr:hydrogenase maturation nickel metallochaperone HypA [Acrocarpospora catenulata]